MLKTAKMSRYADRLGEYMPVDVDMSPFENADPPKKGPIGRHKVPDGYAPNFAYVGAEGYIELRVAARDCLLSKGTPEFLQETFRLLHTLDIKESVLVQIDSKT